MDKEDFVSLDWALKKLGYDEMPKQLAFQSIAEFVDSKQLDLYFDQLIKGTDRSVEVEMQYDEVNGTFLGPFIGNGYSYQHDGIKKSTALYFTSRFSGPKFAIQEYFYNGDSFYVTDSEGAWQREKHLDPNDVFFEKQQIELLSKNQAKNIDGKSKALALLAREMAEDEKRHAFRKGSQVNASGIKEHILKLAEKYGTSTLGLKTVDDMLSKDLQDLDLKDLPKK